MRAIIRAAAAAACFGASGVAHAEEEAVCGDVRVRVEGPLDPRWREPIAKLCENYASIRDADPSAKLLILPAGNDVVAQASLGDGRVAVRHVRSPDELLMTVEALVVLPPASKALSPPVSSSAAIDREAPPKDVERVVTRPRPLGVEVGLAGVGRLSRAPSYLSAGVTAHAGIRPGNWILGLAARFEPVESLTEPNPPDFEMSNAGVGFFVARDILARDRAGIDCGVTTSLVAETQSNQPGDTELGGTQTDVRVGALLRARLGGPTWRFAPSLEAEVSPSRLRRDTRLDQTLPTLPSWSIAIGLGATFEDL